MRSFLFVGDKREVLGVWVVDDEKVARKLRLKLELTYPDCQTIVRRSADYETLKADHDEFEFGSLEPDAAY